MKFRSPTFVVTIALSLTFVSLLFPVSRYVSAKKRAQQEPTNSNRQLGRESSQESNRTNERRIALVIGNGAYTKAPPLKNPPNDARDMAVTLKTLGFDVTSGINVNQRDM